MNILDLIANTSLAASQPAQAYNAPVVTLTHTVQESAPHKPAYRVSRLVDAIDDCDELDTHHIGAHEHVMLEV